MFVFAFLALITFILALFGVKIGSINMVTLGLMFIAAHLCFDRYLPGPASWRRNP